MRKLGKVIYRLLLISVILQLFVYVYINNYYLGSRKDGNLNMKFFSVASMGSSEPDINCKIPTGVANVQVSHNLSYVSYINNGKLEIKETSSGKTVKNIDNTFPAGNSQNGGSGNAGITSYRWLQGKDIVVYALSAPESAKTRVQVMTFDVASGNTHIGANIDEKLVPKGSQAADIILSPLNMVTYVKVKIDKSQSKIFRINIMDELSTLFTTDMNTDIRSGYYAECLVYQTGDSQVYIKNGTGNATQLNMKKKVKLLGVSGDSSSGKDVLYLGELNAEGKVVKIIYGNVGTDQSKWAEMPLKSAASANNLKVENDGSIYQVSESDNSVSSVADGRKETYKGKLIWISGNKIITLENDVLKSKIMK